MKKQTTRIASFGIVVAAFLCISGGARANFGPGKFADTPAYKKCKLQKEIAENDDAAKAVRGMLKNNHDDTKIVGYTTLGNQANINQNKRFLDANKQQRKEMTAELKKYSSVKVNCKEFEASLRASVQEKCVNNPEASIKLNADECREMIERNPELTLWKR